MSGAIIAAIIAAVASIAVAAGSGIASYKAQQKANDFNQQQYEDWKSYNIPESQMQRLSDAGLNPYQVSGVNNSLSQPFQVGSNHGIAEALSGMGNSFQNFGSSALNYAVSKDKQAIQEKNLLLQEKKLDMQLDLQDLRKQLFETSIKRGDAQAALLWSQGSIAQINKEILNASKDFRVGKAKYDYLSAMQSYDFNQSMNPLKLRFYAPYQRALINHLMSQDAHLRDMESFAREQLLDSRIERRENRRDKYYFFGNNYGNERDKFRLSRDYYDLRRSQFQWNILKDIIGFTGAGKTHSVTRKVAGGYPDYTEYGY